MYPLLSDEVVCFKALITIHKLLREGHRSVIPEAMLQVSFLDTVANATTRPNKGAKPVTCAARTPMCAVSRSPTVRASGGRARKRLETAAGYGELIKRYVALLKTKLQFHKDHREFNGAMDYEDYLSLKKANDPQEGYGRHRGQHDEEGLGGGGTGTLLACASVVHLPFPCFRQLRGRRSAPRAAGACARHGRARCAQARRACKRRLVLL